MERLQKASSLKEGQDLQDEQDFQKTLRLLFFIQ
jgi:hypothetical protein